MSLLKACVSSLFLLTILAPSAGADALLDIMTVYGKYGDEKAATPGEASPNKIPAGTIFFDRNTGKWKLEVTIAVFGAEAFSTVQGQRINEIVVTESRRVNGTYPTAEHFRNASPGSFPRSFVLSFPMVAEAIRRQIKGAEAMYNTPFLETKINVAFIDELSLTLLKGELDKPVLAPSDLIGQVIYNAETGGIIKDFLPVYYAATSPAGNVSLSSWNPWLRAEAVAHELFHMLSRNGFNDAYQFVNYLLNSIMGSEWEFLELDKFPGHKATMLAFEFNSLLQAQYIANTGDTSRTSLFLPNIRSLGPDYSSTAQSKDRFITLPSSDMKENMRQKAMIFQGVHPELKPVGVNAQPYMPPGFSCSPLFYTPSRR